MKKMLNILLAALITAGSMTMPLSLYAQQVFMDTSNVKMSAWWTRLALDFQDLIFTKSYDWEIQTNNVLYQNILAQLDATGTQMVDGGSDMSTVSKFIAANLLNQDSENLAPNGIAIRHAIQNYFVKGIDYFVAFRDDNDPLTAITNWFFAGNDLAMLLAINSPFYQSSDSVKRSEILTTLKKLFQDFTSDQARSIEDYVFQNFSDVIERNFVSFCQAYQIGCYLDQMVYGQ